MAGSTALRPHATLTVSTSEGAPMSIAVETIPINQAARALAFPAELLTHLVAAGVVAGDKRYCDLDQAAQVVARLRAAQTPVEGQSILVTEAAKKYGFTRPSIYNWIRAGWVHVLQPEPCVRVNEGDIIVAKILSELVGHTAGRAVFPPKPRSGRPRKER
jgi:hypothetical protein